MVAVLCVLVALVGRARPRYGAPLRGALAAAIVAVLGCEITIAAREGWLGWKTLLPLELCDAALVLTVLTLLRPRPWAAEVVYFWATSGTLLAMLTPDLRYDFPRFEFLVFFGLHGLVLAASTLLVFGLGLMPRPGAALRVFLVTAAWTVFVAVVDVGLGTNFMYLRHKPETATPLDMMGPWPIYIGSAALLGLILFHLLALPFRGEGRRGGGAA